MLAKVPLQGLLIAAALAVCASATAFMPWQVCLFLPTALTILLVEYLRFKEKYPWDYLTLLGIVYFLAFVIAPPLILLRPDKVNINYFVAWEALGEVQIILAAVLSLFGYLAVFAGYTLRKRAASEVRVRPQDQITLNQKLQILSVGFFVVGIASLFIYARIYGGFAALLRESDFIRSDITGDSKFVFLRNLMPFLVPAAWLPFASLPFHHPGLKKVLLLCTGLGVLGIAAFAQLVTAGRSDLLFLLLPVILAPYYVKRRWPPLPAILLLGCATLAWIFAGDAIFAFISYGVSVNQAPLVGAGPLAFVYEFVSEFAHAFLSLVAAVKFAPSVLEFRFFTDFYLGVMSLIPERIFSITLPETISVWNTKFLTGRFQSTVPPGLVASSFYAFSAPGVLLILFGYGFLLARVERFVWTLQQVHPIFSFYYVGIGLSAAYYLILGDPVVYLRGWFYLYTSTLLTVFVLGIKKAAWQPFWAVQRRKLSVRQ